MLPLFPQRTASSSGTIEALARETGEALGLGERLELAALAPDDPGYVDALAERTEAACRRIEGGSPDHLLLSFHGIPRRVNSAEGDRYASDCEATTTALLKALDSPF